MLRALQEPDAMAAAWPVPGRAEVFPVLIAAGEANKAAKRVQNADQALNDEATRARAAINDMAFDAVRHTVARGLDATDGFRERLVAFWADHFTVVAPDLRAALTAAAMVEEAIRPNLTGSFADMLRAVAIHPAMLAYLDQANSVGPDSVRGRRRNTGLNENYARELLELHTMGSGYDQSDVRQLAEALTGLTFDRRTGEGHYDPRLAEPGAETVLGRSYGGETLDMVNGLLGDLALRPETARHLARKLAVHFVSDDPDPALIDTIAAAWSSRGGALMPVYSALLAHPAAWQPELGKARQPLDFLVAALRALGVSGAEVAGWDERRVRHLILDPLAAMGQSWKRPRGPDGWPEEAAAWITPPALSARISWAMKVPAILRRELPDPADFAITALGPDAPQAVTWAAERAEVLAEGVGIVLASAAFNRR
jgi:uncharacterized protein (DUF1800 family)